MLSLHALLVATVGYIGTNLDNFLILVAMAATGVGWPRLALASGLVTAILAAAAFSIGLVAATLPVAHLHYLGLVPLSLGTKGLIDLLRSGTTTAATPKQPSLAVVVLVLLANSADTVAVLAPLIAETDPSLFLPLAGGVALGWAMLIAVLHAGARNRPLMGRLEHLGAPLAPVIMILAGLYVFADTGTDLM